MAKPQSTSSRIKKAPIRDELIYDTIMRLVLADPHAQVRPEDVAMALRRDDWQALTARIRLFARKLAHEGYVHILRKGEIADPDDFRGVYRLRATAAAGDYTPRMPPQP